jgi:hypothetical protein
MCCSYWLKTHVSRHAWPKTGLDLKEIHGVMYKGRGASQLMEFHVGVRVHVYGTRDV